MKAKYYYSLLALLLATSLLSSCTNDTGEVVSGEVKDDMILVSLAPDGYGTTRGTSTNDLYAINVYYDADQDGVCETRYACGLFDNKEDMTILLLRTYFYKFECTLVKDGAHTLYCGSGAQYGYPFQTNSSTMTYVNNAFEYYQNTYKYFTGLGSGKAHIASLSSNPSSSNYTTYPSVNRYYGETDVFKPSNTNTRATIEMKRCVFGAKYVITGVSDGTVVVTSPFGWNKTTTVDCQSDEEIYSYDDVYDCWKNEPDLEFTISMNYTSNRGSWWNISGSQKVKFKRNVMTTVYISVDPDKSSGNFSITEETLGNNNIDLGLNTNGTIDIVVDPQEE